MKKIVYYLFVALFAFERSAAYGVITSPDLATVLINDETHLNQEIQGWTVISKEGTWDKEKVELYAYNAWILLKTKYEPDWQFKYVFVTEDQTKKIVFGKKLRILYSINLEIKNIVKNIIMKLQLGRYVAHGK